MQQDRIHLGLVVEQEIEVVVPGPGRRDCQAAQQDGRGGLEKELVPPRHARRQVSRPDAAFLEQLPGLAVDHLDPADRVRPNVDVAEQPGQPDRPAAHEVRERLRVRLGQVERAGAPVLEIQQRVPPAQVGEGRGPMLLCGPNQLSAPIGGAVVARAGNIVAVRERRPAGIGQTGGIRQPGGFVQPGIAGVPSVGRNRRRPVECVSRWLRHGHCTSAAGRQRCRPRE